MLWHSNTECCPSFLHSSFLHVHSSFLHGHNSCFCGCVLNLSLPPPRLLHPWCHTRRSHPWGCSESSQARKLNGQHLHTFDQRVYWLWIQVRGIHPNTELTCVLRVAAVEPPILFHGHPAFCWMFLLNSCWLSQEHLQMPFGFCWNGCLHLHCCLAVQSHFRLPCLPITWRIEM